MTEKQNGGCQCAQDGRWRMMCWTLSILVSISCGVSVYTLSRVDALAEQLQTTYMTKQEYYQNQDDVKGSLRRIEDRLNRLMEQQRKGQ